MKIGGRAKKRTKPRDPRQAACIFWAFAQCLARIFRLAGRRCAPRCTARFRRLPTMILDPRHASLIAASRNLERNDTRRKRLGRVSFPFRAASHRKTIECSLFQSSIEVLRRPDSLQTACRQPDIGRYRRAAGELPHMAPGSLPYGHVRVTCLHIV